MGVTHDWRPTGRSRIVIEQLPREAGATKRYRYVRCTICRSAGFRRDDSRVVFTWRQGGCVQVSAHPAV